MAATTARQAAIISSRHCQPTFISRASDCTMRPPQLATGTLESTAGSHLAATRKALACGLKPCTTLQSVSTRQLDPTTARAAQKQQPKKREAVKP